MLAYGFNDSCTGSILRQAWRVQASSVRYKTGDYVREEAGCRVKRMPRIRSYDRRPFSTTRYVITCTTVILLPVPPHPPVRESLPFISRVQRYIPLAYLGTNEILLVVQWTTGLEATRRVAGVLLILIALPRASCHRIPKFSSRGASGTCAPRWRVITIH